MQTLISQTREAMSAGLYYAALMCALAIPDIAGALVSDNGQANGKKYAKWYEKWARPRLKEERNRDNPFTGEDCYDFRCAMLHQRKFTRKANGRKTVFIEPGYQNYSMHYVDIGSDTFLIQIDQFVAEILRGCELWLADVQESDLFRNNYEQLARRHSDGFGSIRGIPVIG